MMYQQTELERRLYRELYSKSFYDFVKAFWNTADPSKFVDGKIIKCYCEIFQYMCRKWVGYDDVDIVLPTASKDIDIIDIRQDKNNLCLMVPPRHTKSMIFNVLGPVWLWLTHPIKAVSISHTGGLASQMNEKRYAIINSEQFKYYFADIRLLRNTGSFLKDDRGGELYSLNRNAFTGYGGDVIINDDLTNAESARKDKAEMANAWSYYQNTMPSRINDINKCIIMNIQQRLAPNDIAGHIMNDPKLLDTYCFVTLPAQFKKDTYVVCPISGDTVVWKKDEFLWPERFGDYESLKAQVGEAVFETQYMQNPIASDKTVIKQNMIHTIDKIEAPGIENCDIAYASHDFPVKDKDDSDMLGSILSYRVGSTLYITDCLEKKMAFVKSVEYVKQLDTLFAGIIQIIEDKANGSPILQQLQDEVAGMQAYEPGTSSKMQRLESSSLYLNSGNVVFVKTEFNKLTNEWQLSEALQNLVSRLLDYPFVEADDIIDAFSMLILFVFMDRRYMVYGRSYNDLNTLVPTGAELDLQSSLYNYYNVFFNKEGDVWKAAYINVQYGEETKIIVTKEIRFKASIDDGLKKLKEFAPTKSFFVDCSATPALSGMVGKSTVVERYEIDDFDKSVAQMNLAFSKKRALVYSNCVLTRTDIENFKFTKNKDDTVKYTSEKDGFVACMRVALKYYGGIV